MTATASKRPLALELAERVQAASNAPGGLGRELRRPVERDRVEPVRLARIASSSLESATVVEAPGGERGLERAPHERAPAEPGEFFPGTRCEPPRAGTTASPTVLRRPQAPDLREEGVGGRLELRPSPGSPGSTGASTKPQWPSCESRSATGSRPAARSTRARSSGSGSTGGRP